MAVCDAKESRLGGKRRKDDKTIDNTSADVGGERGKNNKKSQLSVLCRDRPCFQDGRRNKRTGSLAIVKSNEKRRLKSNSARLGSVLFCVMAWWMSLFEQNPLRV